ncbi:MAG: Siderophore synthetase component-like protein [archaeon GW2011_AR20]|nr:MAG: Siderophore synthetase component-like protein [archaeon GW2011_AR20]MBS3160205.1 hypothetical protein [Candidatus Woesearchaeota archaeon]
MKLTDFPKYSPLEVLFIDHSKNDPLDFTINNIILPILQHFNYFVIHNGILLQLHAQNTLLEIDESFKPRRILYRDLGSLTIDNDFRKAGNLEPIISYSIGSDDRFSEEIEYSLRYDEFMASHSFALLGNVLSNHYNINQKIFLIN